MSHSEETRGLRGHLRWSRCCGLTRSLRVEGADAESGDRDLMALLIAKVKCESCGLPVHPDEAQVGLRFLDKQERVLKETVWHIEHAPPEWRSDLLEWFDEKPESSETNSGGITE